MFIVIDWIDWSWKGTQVKLIEQYLKDNWKTVKVFDFPRYDCESSYFVKKYLNWDYWLDVSSKVASQFYAIDRYEASFEIKEALKTCDFVLSNRYVSANMIHQAWKIKDREELVEFLKWLEDLEYETYKIPRPDKVIFLDVDPEIGKKLVWKKEKREYIKWNENADIHEKDINHLINAHNAANFVVDLYSDWVKIDCVENWEILPIPKITNKILSEIL